MGKIELRYGEMCSVGQELGERMADQGSPNCGL